MAKGKKRWRIIALCLLGTMQGPLAFSDTFEIRAGETYEGKILGEDPSNLYVQTSSGAMLNIRKADLSTVNGEPYHYMGQGTAPVKRPPKGTSPTYLGAMSAAERDEAAAGKPGENLAVQFGSVDGQEVPEATPKSSELDTIVHPSGVTERQLKNYYDSHREEFRMPVQLRLKFINPPDMPRPAREILKNPGLTTVWKDAGWMKKGDTFRALFSAEVYERIFNLQKGETALFKDQYGVEYLFWASERKESYIMPYEEVRPKVLTKILQGQSSR